MAINTAVIDQNEAPAITPWDADPNFRMEF
jgi:hypothetical protein